MAARMPIGGIMPELRKPDMQAVLARTNLARHTGGFLLPILEAMSNSIHSINDRFSEINASTSGSIQVIVIDGATDDTFSVTVSDNGSGLDDDNMRAFLTPFTGRKLRKNGQGFGRFIGFKVLKKISYSFQISDDTEPSAFLFDVYADEEITPLEETLPLPFGQGCSVRYSDIRDEYIARWQELSEEQFLDRVTQNFLTYLAAGTMPQTEIVYNGNKTNLRDHFVKRFSHEEQHNFTIELDSKVFEFTLDVSRSEYGKPYNHHTLLFLPTIEFSAGVDRSRINLVALTSREATARNMLW